MRARVTAPKKPPSTPKPTPTWVSGMANAVKAVDATMTQINALSAMMSPTPMLLWCPWCGKRHIDVGEFATKPHHTHACQSCGMVWRPALVPTVGVQHLPGFKNP